MRRAPAGSSPACRAASPGSRSGAWRSRRSTACAPRGRSSAGAAADAEYGKAAAFRAGLTERGLLYAVGIGPLQKVYPADEAMVVPAAHPSGRRRPPRRPVPVVESRSVAKIIAVPGARRRP
ncbi:transposase [Arenibaculum sp.]|uniref:transposase n=1 Tax=Arenibaculum sp. TaxID=2865862 RepID=UPI0039C86A74